MRHVTKEQGPVRAWLVTVVHGRGETAKCHVRARTSRMAVVVAMRSLEDEELGVVDTIVVVALDEMWRMR